MLWIDDRTLLVTSDLYRPVPATPARPSTRPARSSGWTPPASRRARGSTTGCSSATGTPGTTTGARTCSWCRSRAVPARDLTPGDRDVPPFTVGGADDYAVSPDGTEVAFARNDDAVEATSTNADLYVVPTRGGAAVKISASAGYDGTPRYSPDGTKIAFRSQERAGFEADRWRLMVYDRRAKTLREAAAGFDRHVEEMAWSPDSKTLFFAAGDDARQRIFSVPAAGGTGHRARRRDLRRPPGDPRRARARRDHAVDPPPGRDRARGRGRHRRAAAHPRQRRLPGRLRPPRGRERQLHRGRGQARAGLDREAGRASIPRRSTRCSCSSTAARRACGATRGPSAGTTRSSPTPATWSSPPTRAARSGWGQQFVDDITLDWEGKVYEDLMKGVDWAEALPYVDKGRTSAAGASLRRLHGELDRRPHRPLPRARLP